MKPTRFSRGIFFKTKAFKVSGAAAFFLGVILMLVDAIGPFAGNVPSPPIFLFREPAVRQEGGAVRVARVVDGDTIELDNGEKVRYIGVNAPESVKPRSPVECFGREASAKNKELVEGKSVRLEKDVSDRDRYGRLLRFVYLEDGTFVNDELVRQGYAYADTFPPDVSKADQFREAQREARENRRGLWAEDACEGKRQK
jgi:micrococcal nuclease